MDFIKKNKYVILYMDFIKKNKHAPLLIVAVYMAFIGLSTVVDSAANAQNMALAPTTQGAEAAPVQSIQVQEKAPETRQPTCLAPPASLLEQESGLVFTALTAEPVGVAGLDPTSAAVLIRLEGDAQARASGKLKTGSGAQGAAGGFMPSSGGSYSAQVRSWQGINTDIKGWLRVPGTNINYPVAHHPDIDYYNARGYYKESSHNGVIWTNGGTSFGTAAQISNNTVLYGHNWTNVSSTPAVGSGGVMFAQLTGYHYLSTAQSHPYLYYSTADQDMVFKIFAVFYTEPQFNYIAPSGGQYIIDEARQRSRFSFDVDVNGSDKILTLSTCTRAYGNTSNQRFVVMARLLRPGEGTGAYSITDNPGHKQPSVW